MYAQCFMYMLPTNIHQLNITHPRRKGYECLYIDGLVQGCNISMCVCVLCGCFCLWLTMHLYISVYDLTCTHARLLANKQVIFISNPCVSSLRHPLHWRHNERDGVSNHQPHDCLLNCSFRRRSKKTSMLRVTDDRWITRIQKASNAENVSIWCRHHDW